MWRIALAWLMVVATPAMAMTFSAGLDDSSWQNQGDIFECRLKHAIPGYGDAEFVTRAGEQARFVLNSWQRPMQKGMAQVVQQPPHWDQFNRAQALGDVKVRSGRQPVRLAGPIPTQMLRALKQGQGTAIRRLAWFDSKEQIDVRLSTVNFQQAYRGYMSCLSSLLPVNFDQIRRTSLYFESNAGVLSELNTELLDSIALYIKADPDVAQVIIDGHTDDIGRRLQNRELSRERAEEVRAYLLQFGLDESMFMVRFHGERYPVVRNNSSKNRALNRRVTLQLKKRYEVERDERKAALRAKRIADAIEAGEGAVVPSAQAVVPSQAPGATGASNQAPAQAPTFDQAPTRSQAPSVPARSDAAQPVLDPFASEPAQPAAIPPQAALTTPQPGAKRAADAQTAAGQSVMGQGLPSSALDSALPSSGLDSNLPSSGLDTGLPSTNP